MFMSLYLVQWEKNNLASLRYLQIIKYCQVNIGVFIKNIFTIISS